MVSHYDRKSAKPMYPLQHALCHIQTDEINYYCLVLCIIV